MSQTPFPTLLSFLPLPPESVCMDRHVLTSNKNFLGSIGFHSLWLWGFALCMRTLHYETVNKVTIDNGYN